MPSETRIEHPVIEFAIEAMSHDQCRQAVRMLRSKLAALESLHLASIVLREDLLARGEPEVDAAGRRGIVVNAGATAWFNFNQAIDEVGRWRPDQVGISTSGGGAST